MPLSDLLPLILGSALVAVVASLALAGKLVSAGRATRGQLLRGLRNGALVTLALVALVTALVFVASVGRVLGLAQVLTPGTALALGLLVALPVGLGYLVLGLAVMVVGLIGRRSARWATRDAWLVAPLVALVGVAAFGLASSMTRIAGEPLVRGGSITLTVAGAQLGEITASGPAHCSLRDTGVLSIDAGQELGPSPLSTADGRPVALQFRLSGNGGPAFTLGIGDLATERGRGPAPTFALAPDSGTSSGTLDFSGLVPLTAEGEASATESWRGSMSWECSY